MTTAVYQKRPKKGGSRRVTDGRRIYDEYVDEILESYAKGVFWVPSRSRPELLHAVTFTPNVKACTCEDHYFNKAKCAHIIAAGLASAKSGVCQGCASRALYAELREVMEDGAFLEGELICRDCARREMVEVA